MIYNIIHINYSLVIGKLASSPMEGTYKYENLWFSTENYDQQL